MSKTVIYFDGGGGGIRAAAGVDGIEKNYKDFPGITPGEGSLVDYLANVVTTFANQFEGSISRAVLAVATLPADTKSYQGIANLVFKNSKVEELWICSDSVSSCAAAIETDGVVITAGTGITALAVGKSGTILHSLSGDGHLIGDVASAYWIGRMGLNYALRSSDGRDQTPGAAQLLAVACQHFNADPYHLPHVVHQSNRAVHAIAQFAQLVNELAASGNATALEIIDKAGDEIVLIADTARRVCEGGKDFQVALLGGVLAENTMTYKNVVSKIKASGMMLHKPNKSPLEGAKILANKDDAGIYSPMIKIYRSDKQ
ncbi:MAG: hypothetical protein FJW82_02385 [Actinobacteria bacterium]|nr:hypothetical protein [Actinomycetota bacterium]